MRSEEFLEATLGSMDLVYNLARRCVRDQDAASDITQETYLRAFEAWQRGGRPERVEPWLATICLNLVRSQARRRKRRVEEVFEFADEAPADSDVEAEATANVRRDVVREALWRLPEEQRIAVSLVDLCGLTHAEAAKLTGCPRGTMLSRVHRGRKALAAIVRRQVQWRES